MEAADEAKLLELIARQRDHHAYAQLYQVCGPAMYSLAYNITGRREAAEDVVQEAMCRIWESAASYRAEGPARAWILAIVGRASLKHLHRQRRFEKEKETENATGQPYNLTEAEPVQNTETSELMDALRSVLDKLSATDRQLVSLHYGSELSHHEIAATLSMPRATVSFRINKALESMRRQLASAGFAAGALGMEALLTEAVCGGQQIPLTLQDRVLAVPQAHEPASILGMPKRTAMWIAASALTMATVAGGIYVYSNSAAVQPPEATLAAATLAPVAAPIAKSDWQPATVEPLIKLQSRGEFPDSGQQIRIQLVEGGDAQWLTGKTAEGAYLEQTAKLNGYCVALLATMESGAKEWSGILDYANAAPDGGTAVMIADGRQSTGRFLGCGFVDKESAPLRIVVWPIEGGVRIVSMRKLSGGRFGGGAETLPTADGTYRIGLVTSTYVAVRNFKMRKLPADWKPENDPELAPFAGKKKVKE